MRSCVADADAWLTAPSDAEGLVPDYVESSRLGETAQPATERQSKLAATLGSSRKIPGLREGEAYRQADG